MLCIVALASGAARSADVTWSVSPGGGTIGADTGVYVAPHTPGTYTVTAVSVADPGKRATSKITVPATSATDLDRLRALSSKRIYFQHASVGGEVCGVYDPGGFTAPWGLLKIIADNPGSGTSVGRSCTTAEAIPAGTIGELGAGQYNGQPAAKLTFFDTTVRAGLGGVLDMVLLKLGYADFDQNGNLTGAGGGHYDAWFAGTYKPAMDALQARYPSTAVVHVTVPLNPCSAYWGNAGMHAFNELLRKNYPPNRVFDLAYWQSVSPSNSTPQIGEDGAPCMNDAWKIPGDAHVNQAGANWLAKKLLAFLAGIG